MTQKRQRKRFIAEMNIVPYVDVMLVLLVIFMITTPLLSQGIKVNLPQTKAQTISQQHKEPIIISVDKIGNFYLNINDNPDTAVAPQYLVNRVAAELQLNNDQEEKRLVLVRGDSGVDYGKVVEVMGLLQSAGAGNIGLVTEASTSKQVTHVR